jgi:hypothetical protein
MINLTSNCNTQGAKAKESSNLKSFLHWSRLQNCHPKNVRESDSGYTSLVS